MPAALEPGVWHCLANSYDGAAIRAYVNGTLDPNATSVGPNPQAGSDPDNPFLYPNPPRFPNGGIFTPPTGGGANFSMGANFIHDGGGIGPGLMGNKFVGLVGAFAVYNESMSAAQLTAVCGAPPAQEAGPEVEVED